MSTKSGAFHSASIHRLISFDEMQALIRRGATEKYGVQKIRVFKEEVQGVTFSVPCANCERWVYCGDVEHQGTCFCGQKYEITFDSPGDLNLPWGWLCMNCGEPFELAEVGSDRNRGPWRAINERQQVCNICFGMDHVGAWWVQKQASERRKAEKFETGPAEATVDDPDLDDADAIESNGINPYAPTGIDPYAFIDEQARHRQTRQQR